MAKQRVKRWPLKYLGAAVLAWAVVISVMLVTFAADITVTNPSGTILTGQLTYSATAEVTSGQASTSTSSAAAAVTNAGSGKVTLSATSSVRTKDNCSKTSAYAGTTTLTVTVTNASSYPLRFDSISHAGSATISGISEGGSLASGSTFTITLAAKPDGDETDTATTVSDIITFTVTELTNVTLTALPSTYASYSAGSLSVAQNGEAVTGTVTPGTTVTPALTGSVSSGYSLLGWRLGDGSFVEAGQSITVGADMTIYPIIMPTGTSITGGPFSVGGTNYTFWEDAVTAAVKSGSSIILAADHTLPNTLEGNAVSPDIGGCYVKKGEDGKVELVLPATAKLLIPYTSSDTGTFGATPPQSSTLNSSHAAYRVLTVPSGIRIINNGAININAQQYSTSSSNPGCVAGDYGRMELESGAELDLQSGSLLYCYGYITGKGDVYARTGSTAYEFMQIMDWRGGQNSLTLVSSMDSFLFSQYYVQNIEASTHYFYNAKLNVCVTVTVSGSILTTTGELMGPTGLFRLAEGTELVRTYDPVTDRIVYDLYGDMVTDYIVISLSMLGFSITMDSSEHIFPIQSNYTFNLRNGRMTLSQKFKLLPSCEINVEKGAELAVASGGELYIYDVDDWRGNKYVFNGKDLAPINYSPTKAITRTSAGLTSASLRIDGTLTANGAVYSTAGGEGLTGTGVFVNYVSAPGLTLDECASGTTIINVGIQPVVGILAGISTSSSDYTKKFTNPETYYGTPAVVDNNGNILKESAWYQYAVNVAAPTGQDICKGVVAYNADDGGVYSLGGSYETATIGTTTINNVVGYAANGLDADKNPVSGTFRFKVAGYT
ncbi:MAG: hypothetical protein Q4C45_00485, partial [Oscillospiraceae bacterium]|nr:hypothetical protein [Oscillospiraceae bacterium]